VDAEVDFVGFEALVDDFDGFGAVFDFLEAGVRVLKGFVDREEVLDFGEDVFGQVCDVFPLVHLGFFEGDGDDFFVEFVVICHGEDTNRVAFDEAHGLELLGAEHEDVERISVISQGARDEAVVGRVVGRGVQDAVELEHASRLVHLVFLLAAFGNLDDGDEFLGFDPGIGNIMPDIHGLISPLVYLSLLLISIADSRKNFLHALDNSPV